MSHDIFVKECSNPHEEDLILTAFMGRNGDASIQVTIGTAYAKLDSKQALEMAITILRRLNRDDGFRATD